MFTKCLNLDHGVWVLAIFYKITGLAAYMLGPTIVAAILER